MTESRTVLITGASGGIGSAIAQAFIHEAVVDGTPLRLALHASPRSLAAAETLARDLGATAAGIEVQSFAADLTDVTACQELVAAVLAWAGRLDGLVSNAGQSRPARLADMTLEQWENTLNLNLRATFVLAQAARSALAASGGSITAVSSMSGQSPHSGYGVYSTAKAGLNMLCRQIAQEWAVDGIRANSVCPGMIRTPLTESIYENAEAYAARKSLVPLGRIGSPKDIAEAVVFLSGARASYITGQELRVDGGLVDAILDKIPGRPDKR